MEEFPVQALPHFPSISGHPISDQGLIVVVLQYGTRKIDFLGKGRAENDWTKAWKSNFLHPVLYYYDRLPTGKWKCLLLFNAVTQEQKEIHVSGFFSEKSTFYPGTLLLRGDTAATGE